MFHRTVVQKNVYKKENKYSNFIHKKTNKNNNIFFKFPKNGLKTSRNTIQFNKTVSYIMNQN